MAKPIDLTNKKFGKLTVVSFHGYSDTKIKKRQWLCLCECGNKKIVIGERLKSNNTSSCGCIRKNNFNTKRNKDLTGKRFNRLTVIKCVGSKDYNGNKKRQWLCKCDCGNETIQDASCLASGKRLSCGCAKREVAKDNSIKSRHKIAKESASFNVIFGSYKNAAIKRKLEWNLGKNEFKLLIESNCHYCGQIPSNTYRYCFYNFKYSGVDRMNNDKGYFLENCVPCCKTCNHAKATMSYDDFINWIKKVYEFKRDDVFTWKG